MLANKEAVANVNGLNQLYQLAAINENSDRKQVIKNKDANFYSTQNLGNQILIQVDVDREVQHIQEFGKVGNLIKF